MSAAERQRRYRERQREGRRVVMVEIDEAALSDVLVETGHLSPVMADDPEHLRRAIERHLSRLTVGIMA
jgi:hypothetical protein